MLDPELESAMRGRFDSSTFVKWMGIELVALDAGTSEIRLELEEHHLNPGGIAHGGIIATLLDIAIGLAQRTNRGMDAPHVTVQLAINYLRPARPGPLIARGTSVRSGERVGYGEATLSDPEGNVLARGSATFLTITVGGPDGE